MQVRSQLAILTLAAASSACSTLPAQAPLRDFNALSPAEKNQFSTCVVKTTPSIALDRVQQGVNETMARNPNIAPLFKHPETQQTMITSVAVSLAQADCATAQRIIPQTVPPIKIQFQINRGNSPTGQMI